MQHNQFQYIWTQILIPLLESLESFARIRKLYFDTVHAS